MEMRKYIVTIDRDGTIKATEYEKPRCHVDEERAMSYDQWDRYLYCLAGYLKMRLNYMPHYGQRDEWKRGYKTALIDFKKKLLLNWADIF